MSESLTEDQLNQMLRQQLGRGIAETAEVTIVRGGGPTHDQGRIIESLKVHEHGEKIESLNKEIQKKDDEIVALQKALQELREKNDELNSALKSKDVEIAKLTSRIDELEEEKRGLQKKLGSVELDLGLLRKEVEKLTKAKSSQEQTSLRLQQDLDRVWRNMETVKGDLEKKTKENDDLKKEMKEIKASQHKGLLPLMLGARGSPIKPPPSTTLPKTSLEALLHLGEMCRQLQIKLYKSVFPNSFVKNMNYKVGTIQRHLKFPNTEEAKNKWVMIQKKFNWKEMYEEAMILLQETRNAEAHPEISKESLQCAISMMNQTNDLTGWFSLELLKDLMHMWETELP